MSRQKKKKEIEDMKLVNVNGAVGASWEQLDEQAAVLDLVLHRLDHVRRRIKDDVAALKLSLPPPRSRSNSGNETA